MEQIKQDLALIKQEQEHIHATLARIVINQEENRKILEGDPSGYNTDGLKGKIGTLETRVSVIESKVGRLNYISNSIFMALVTAAVGYLINKLAA